MWRKDLEGFVVKREWAIMQCGPPWRLKLLGG